jgi:hypothetical protein
MLGNILFGVLTIAIIVASVTGPVSSKSSFHLSLHDDILNSTCSRIPLFGYELCLDTAEQFAQLVSGWSLRGTDGDVMFATEHSLESSGYYLISDTAGMPLHGYSLDAQFWSSLPFTENSIILCSDDNDRSVFDYEVATGYLCYNRPNLVPASAIAGLQQLAEDDARLHLGMSLAECEDVLNGLSPYIYPDSDGLHTCGTCPGSYRAVPPFGGMSLWKSVLTSSRYSNENREIVQDIIIEGQRYGEEYSDAARQVVNGMFPSRVSYPGGWMPTPRCGKLDSEFYNSVISGFGISEFPATGEIALIGDPIAARDDGLDLSGYVCLSEALPNEVVLSDYKLPCSGPCELTPAFAEPSYDPVQRQVSDVPFGCPTAIGSLPCGAFTRVDICDNCTMPLYHTCHPYLPGVTSDSCTCYNFSAFDTTEIHYKLALADWIPVPFEVRPATTALLYTPIPYPGDICNVLQVGPDSFSIECSTPSTVSILWNGDFLMVQDNVATLDWVVGSHLSLGYNDVVTFMFVCESCTQTHNSIEITLPHIKEQCIDPDGSISDWYWLEMNYIACTVHNNPWPSTFILFAVAYLVANVLIIMCQGCVVGYGMMKLTAGCFSFLVACCRCLTCSYMRHRYKKHKKLPNDEPAEEGDLDDGDAPPTLKGGARWLCFAYLCGRGHATTVCTSAGCDILDTFSGSAALVNPASFLVYAPEADSGVDIASASVMVSIDTYWIADVDFKYGVFHTRPDFTQKTVCDNVWDSVNLGGSVININSASCNGEWMKGWYKFAKDRSSEHWTLDNPAFSKCSILPPCVFSGKVRKTVQSQFRMANSNQYGEDGVFLDFLDTNVGGVFGISSWRQQATLSIDVHDSMGDRNFTVDLEVTPGASAHVPGIGTVQVDFLASSSTPPSAVAAVLMVDRRGRNKGVMYTGDSNYLSLSGLPMANRIGELQSSCAPTSFQAIKSSECNWPPDIFSFIDEESAYSRLVKRLDSTFSNGDSVSTERLWLATSAVQGRDLGRALPYPLEPSIKVHDNSATSGAVAFTIFSNMSIAQYVATVCPVALSVVSVSGCVCSSGYTILVELHSACEAGLVTITSNADLFTKSLRITTDPAQYEIVAHSSDAEVSGSISFSGSDGVVSADFTGKLQVSDITITCDTDADILSDRDCYVGLEIEDERNVPSFFGDLFGGLPGITGVWSDIVGGLITVLIVVAAFAAAFWLVSGVMS